MSYIRRYPVNQPFSIENTFGMPDSAAAFGFHAGEDFGLPVGREVFAEVSGTITDYILGQYHGNTVQIYDGKNYLRYMHNLSLKVRPGDTVKTGQVIAISGATGQGITGPHVHRDISTQKFPSSFAAFINPAIYLTKKEDVIKPYIAPETIKALFKHFEVAGDTRIPGTPSPSQIEYYSKHPGGYTQLYEDLLHAVFGNYKHAQQTGNFELITYPLYKRK